MKQRLALTLLTLFACTLIARADALRAVAVVHPTKGSNVHGVVWFTQEGKKVHVVADFSGLTPGVHGFHIHEFGDCTADDATSAGSHYNPAKMPHAAPTVDHRHEGDLGNITADASGKAHLDVTDAKLTLTGPDSIIGRSVIVHVNPDDLKTQPTGNAGARAACGVIGIAAPAKQ